jgi:hypothetical protein
MTDKKSDPLKANELEAKIIGHMRLCAQYADMADGASSIHDSGLIIILTDKFLEHARDCSKALKELRQLRGVLD